MNEKKVCLLCLNTDKRVVPATKAVKYERSYPDNELPWQQKHETVILFVCQACFELVTDGLDEASISWEELPLDENEKVLLT